MRARARAHCACGFGCVLACAGSTRRLQLESVHWEKRMAPPDIQWASILSPTHDVHLLSLLWAV